jgi:two-component system alkaline phosphatase synthesis response regulator PhoP
MNKERIKILVTDDEQDVREILSYNLRKENYNVYTATSGEDCIEKAEQILPDLIIMDIRMNGMTGIEACRIIRENEQLKNTPVLFLSADSDEYTAMNAIISGGNHFVTKPIRPAILMHMIKELIEQKKLEVK